MTTQSRWTLPDVVNPTTSVCFTVPVPNNKYHIAAFLGAVFELTKAYSWQNDASHTALLVAAVWKPIWAALVQQGCNLIEFQQPDDCDLQISYDSGLTWSTIFNALACAIGAADGEIADGLANGKLSGPTQSGPLSPPAIEMCWNYHVVLPGAGLWFLPFAVNDGWTITISNAAGGAYDGAILPLPLWYCPDGGVYDLGACGGGTAGELTDPLPTVDHMRLIMRVGTVYTDAYNLSYTVPLATGSSNVTFQVNDGVLTDNAGTFSFDLQVCNAPAIALTYGGGATGPAVMPGVGGTFIVTSHDDGGGEQAVTISWSRLGTFVNVELKVLSAPGYSSFTFGGANVYEYIDDTGANVFRTYPTYTTPVGADVCCRTFYSVGQTSFTIEFEVMAIDCP